MKSTFVVVFLLGVLCDTISAQNSVLNDEKKINAALNNNIILNNYLKCLLETGECTRDGRQLKSKWPFLSD